MGRLQKSVSSWVPVSGYDIYRGTQSGGPYNLLLGSVDAQTLSYQDTDVTVGASYCYVVTSFAANGVQSVESNETCVAIPASFDEKNGRVSARIK